MLRTEQILNAKFTPVSRGTYNAEEVDAFLKTVAESYEESLNQNKELIKKISILADKIESYRNDEEAIKRSLLDAHRMADSINKEATDKADAKVQDAENRSKIILDGANRQSGQMIDEAREKAKEIVDNARTAVASLTERAQIETDNAIIAAKNKAAEIVADAEAEGKKILGNSKESYEYYSAELAKVKEETAKFKEAIQNLCKGQLNLLDGIPEGFAAAVAAVATAQVEPEVVEEPVAAPAVEEPAEEVVAVEEEAPAESIIPDAEDILAQIEEESQIIYVPEEPEAEEINVIEEIEVVEEASEPVEEIIIEEPVEVIEEDSDDDLFGFIDEIDFDNESIPSSLDDLIPSIPVAVYEAEEQQEEEDEFDGFKVDLDAIDGMGSQVDLDDDDDDITSLFDSMFED